MRKRFVFVGLVLLLALALGLSACGKQAPTQAPAAPTQAQPATMSYDQALNKALEAAKAGDAESAKTALQAALQAAKNDADKAFVNELLENVDKGDLDEVVEDIERYLGAGESPTFADLLDKAMEAAKAGNADKAKEELTEALDLATSDADKAFVNELLEDVDKGDLDEVAEDIERYLEQQQSSMLSSDEVTRAKQLYTQLACFSCHGADYEGNSGPIIVGLPVQTIIDQVRNGAPNGEMPAFDQNMISDADLEILAKFLNSLTIADTSVVIPDEVRTHLQQAYDALNAGDKAGVETHLKAALQSAQDLKAGEGLIKTLDDMVEDLEEETWQQDVELHLDILLGQ